MFVVKRDQIEAFRIPMREAARDKLIADLADDSVDVSRDKKTLTQTDQAGNKTTLSYSADILPTTITKPSGPASSGERALGLTVPLFAAVSSFYSQGSHAHAPRLVLLDEAFAGIDDAARAHCMGLIHEFDLDFVITSEREWACYAELPGVAIAQLQRHEGIDAVHVSRWAWDGRARRHCHDPDRRFPPRMDAADDG